MKTTLISVLLLITTQLLFAQGVVINESGDAPHASAMLEVQSNEKGFLPPRMTSAERNAIPSPASGLVVYDTDNQSIYLFNGTQWEALSTSSGVQWLENINDIYYDQGNVGIGTANPVAVLHTQGDGPGEGSVVFEGTYKSVNPGPPPVEGVGTRMMWYPDRGAFRVGFVDDGYWDEQFIGDFSIAMGRNLLTTGINSMAWGKLNESSGETSTTWGNNNLAWGEGSTAFGIYAQAGGLQSTAWGQQTRANNDRATAWGNGAYATGIESTAWGYQSEASGKLSTAWGMGTQAFSLAETALGMYNTSYTPNSANGYNIEDRLFVIGGGSAQFPQDVLVILKSGFLGLGTSEPKALLHTNGVYERGNIVFAGVLNNHNPSEPPVQGLGTRMMWLGDKAAIRAGYVNGAHWDDSQIGHFSNAWGNSTTASGENSTAFGTSTTASGFHSTTWGSESSASGHYATSWGFGTAATSYAETVFGQYNTNQAALSFNSWNANDRLFVIGNGTSDVAKSNALTVLKNGNIGMGGVSNPSVKLDILLATGRSIQFTNSGVEPLLQCSHSNWGMIGKSDQYWYQAYVNTYFGINSSIQAISDRKMKTNIRPVEGTLEKVMQLEPVTYDYITQQLFKDEATMNKVNLNDIENQMGFIAQDVQKLFPHLVKPLGENSDVLTLGYTGLVPIIVKAMQEQQQIIVSLHQENQEARKALTDMAARIEQLEAAMARQDANLQKADNSN